MLGPHVFPAKDGGSDPRACPACGTGRLSLKISGKYGAFIGCGNYPECRYTRQLANQGGADAATPNGKQLGEDPATGLAVTLRNGRFGPYVQLGDGAEDDKPKRASVPKSLDAASLELEAALNLLSLPREVGLHPETGQPVSAGIGRYGPFVLHEGTYANLDSVDDVFNVGLNRAVALIADKKSGKGGRFGRAAAKQTLKDLGEHPDLGGKVEVLNGRYGPYVSHNKINANVPKGKDPAELTIGEAVDLLAERAAKGGGKKKPAPKAPKAGGKAPKKAKAAKADAESGP
jgi:DNA topoisomerase-1